MYNILSEKASEFIDHQEITATLDYAVANRSNRALQEEIINKAAECKGLTHREAAVLMECEDKELNEQIFKLARKLKEKLYGRRIVLFAPLYLSNYCVNSCLYCPFHGLNKDMPRRKLTTEDIIKEVTALQDMGHKRIALETGEHPYTDINYVLDSIRTIYSVKHKNGAIRRVNVNIAATTVENYRKLKQAGIGTYILFQETYNEENYRRYHPAGPKSDYAWHTEAMDRAMNGGIDDVGMGVLFGLSDYRYDLTALLMHAEHLETVHGAGPHTISVPRICPAEDIDLSTYSNIVSDETFLKIVALIRISVPYTGMIMSTRENMRVREQALQLGISQISGASCTGIGGYEVNPDSDTTAQFEVSDHRSLDEVVGWLLDLGYLPSFCTACYAQGRTGTRFMGLVKKGLIAGHCKPNALHTLGEYLKDYASPAVKAKGEEVIRIMQEQPDK